MPATADTLAAPPVAAPPSESKLPLLMGLLGVCGFSLTLSMTRIAVAEMNPVVVGLGRSLVSASLAAAVLLWKRDPFPGARYLPRLLVVTLGVIVGFPLLSAMALTQVPAAHGSVVTALIPLFTALVAALFSHERPSALFWASAVAGSLVVVVFVAVESGLSFRLPDLYLLLAVLTCAAGYAEGGRLSRELGGWRVISWALVLAAPILAIPVVLSVHAHGLHASPRAWAAFGYMGVVSMFLAFWAWYYGLAKGGVARVSQVQLLQPFLGLMNAHLLLGEVIRPGMIVAAGLVVGLVAVSRKAPIGDRREKAAP